MIFVQCSPYPNQNSGATPVHLISIHIITVICTLSQKIKTLSLFQNLKKITAAKSSPTHTLVWWYAFRKRPLLNCLKVETYRDPNSRIYKYIRIITIKNDHALLFSLTISKNATKLGKQKTYSALQ